jgi:hypothetical protein
VHGGKVRELSKSTKRIQSLALDKMQGFLSGEVRLEVFVKDETKEAEICGTAGEVTSCLLAEATVPLRSGKIALRTLSCLQVYLSSFKAT